MEAKKIQEFLTQVESLVEDAELRDDTGFRSTVRSSFFSFTTNEQAEIISDLKGKNREEFVELVMHDIDAEVLFHFERAVLNDFVEIVGSQVLGRMLSVVNVNMAVSIISDLAKDLRKEVLEFVQYKKRIKIKRLLAYPEDTVGRNMSPDYLSVPSTFAVKDAMAYLQKQTKNQDKDVKNLEIFVLDEGERVVGSFSIFELIKLKHSESIALHSKPVNHILNTYDSVQEAVEIFIEHRIQVIPVVDRNGKIAGILEINNVTNLIREEAEKNLLAPAGVFEAKKEGLSGLVKARFLWLFINLLTASFAASVISFFEDIVASFAVLAVLTPIVASIGGNTGNQTSATIIRAIATKEFEVKMIFREISVALINGAMFSSLCLVVSYSIYSNFMLALSFGLAIWVTLTVGGTIGSLVPVALSKMKIDPTLCSSIFLTMTTDMMGFFAFLGIAKILLF